MPWNPLLRRLKSPLICPYGYPLTVPPPSRCITVALDFEIYPVATDSQAVWCLPWMEECVDDAVLPAATNTYYSMIHPPTTALAPHPRILRSRCLYYLGDTAISVRDRIEWPELIWQPPPPLMGYVQSPILLVLTSSLPHDAEKGPIQSAVAISPRAADWPARRWRLSAA